MKIESRTCICCSVVFDPWHRDQVSCSRSCSNINRLKSREISRKNFVYRIMTKYDMTFEAYGEMLIEQSGCCAFCSSQFEGKDEPHVDHDHNSGRIRGLLCNSCNVSKVGSHDLASALRLVEYLKASANAN